MRQVKARAAAPNPTVTPLAWSVAALSSLVLLLAALPGHAATGDADVLGRWITGKNQPDMDYRLSAGPSGKLVVTVPAKAVGRAKGETVTLDRVGPDEFATPKGGKIHASFKVTGPGRAEFKMMINRPDAFNVTDQLLERP
ncbi:MAG TPA: hypothetical protein VNW53_07605 [Phenylobacterium sp.]|jgi:hypothetical protein|uniref:hypothetical protein n=1 Tax=Phenylobacterium sp. TaxID=1871053 RepID=UPI002C5FBB14|nr:hypothetical protein [Phenylobacterium sp.]HXA38846.1 hypothetical protein [Phenylobacterium sp.]